MTINIVFVSICCQLQKTKQQNDMVIRILHQPVDIQHRYLRESRRRQKRDREDNGMSKVISALVNFKHNSKNTKRKQTLRFNHLFVMQVGGENDTKSWKFCPKSYPCSVTRG